ncbi:MAG: hypothetical protein LBC39_04990 [Methanobrevibacter sp.]|nr:hypothetical protein [Candidatus Methanovirga aequatorialis]
MKFIVKFLSVLLLCGLFGVHGIAGPNNSLNLVAPNDSLRGLVANSGNDKVIYLRNGSYSGFWNRGVVVNKNLTIVGSNFSTSVSGDSAERIFVVNPNCHLTLINVSLANGSSDKGGLIFCNINASLDLVNCRFMNSKSLYGGGAIYLNHNNVSIVNCSFTNNRVDAYNGGALFNNGSNLKVENCSFGSNHGYFGGALYDVPFGSKKTTIIDSNFTDNSVDANGGAICTVGGAGFTIQNSHFKENRVPSPSLADYGKGGAIYNKGTKDFNIRSTDFNDNYAVNGACVFNDEDGEVNMIGSDLTGNTAGDGAVYNNKGAFYITGGSNVKDNVASSGYGGAIVNKDFIKITISSLDNNRCNGYGGAIYSNAGSVVIADCELNDNVGVDTGGAISATNTNIQITATDFKNNVAGTGGGIHANNCQIRLDDNRRGGNLFENNSANSQDGGGIFLMGKNSGSISNTIFKLNKCVGRGGGIFCGYDMKCVNNTTSSTGTLLVLDKIQYKNNSAGKGGVNVHSSRYGDMKNIGETNIGETYFKWW